MTTEIIRDKDRWDKFVDESPYGTIFHKWDFLKILEKYSGYRLLTYGVYNGNQLICVFPLFLRSYMGLKLLFSPPPSINMPYLGFLMSPMYDSVKQKRKESYLDEVVREISAEIKKLSTNYVSTITAPGFRDIRPFKWHDYETTSATTTSSTWRGLWTISGLASTTTCKEEHKEQRPAPDGN